MKIAIMSDLHLGFRQYGSMEREEDFYQQFYKVCKEINKHNPNIVIIAGDLFNTPNPSPSAIHAYSEGVGNLSADMIFVIKGNHTMILREDHYSIDKFFEDDADIVGYYYLDDISFSTKDHAMNSDYDMEFIKYINKEEVVIDGITYRTNSNINEFLEVQKQLAQKEYSENAYRILVVHQSFKEFCGFTGEELSIEDIDYIPYDAIVCGHIHSRFDTVLSDMTKFIQPGSIERMNTTEALDEQKNGKGFYLLDTEDNSLEFHKVDCIRDFLLGEVEIKSNEDLEKHIEEVNKIIENKEVQPIISYKYKTDYLNTARVYDKINDVKQNVLLNKSNVYTEDEREITLEITDSEMPTVIEALKMRGKEEGLTDDHLGLVSDLYNSLIGENPEEKVKALLDDYFEKHKTKEVFYEEDKEVEELIKYFEEE